MPEDSKQTVPSAEGEFYTPSDFWPKLIFLVAGIVVLVFGLSFMIEPANRLLFGEYGKAKVAMIVRTEPGEQDQTIRYRKKFDVESNMAVHFQHWVSINVDGSPRLYRLGVDSRREPYLAVNDSVDIVYYPDEEDGLAFAPKQARTWGIGLLYVTIGLSFTIGGIPMLYAVGKPIRIDPEAPKPETEDEQTGATGEQLS